MCGIVGIYHSNQPINANALKRACQALSHRGPDGQNIWISQDQQVGLGHTRLAIVDEQGGAQPLLNQDKTICASVNGELYDYAKLRHDLERKGYCFSSRSDSELVIHLYAEYDLDFVRFLRGEFSFLLYDQGKKRMIAARDRFGIKPLCYYSQQGALYVASEAKALFKLGIQPAWNDYALYHAFCFQYPPVNQTLFKGIQQVSPGHMLIYDGEKLIDQLYWDLDDVVQKTQPSQTFEDLSLQLDIALRDAIDVRLKVDDAQMCCHLSGGVDSATIAALSSLLYGKPLPCFSVSFPHEAYNEITFAADFAKKIGSPFHPIHVDAHDMVSVLSDAVFHTEGLAINHHLSAKYILNREIKKAGFKVALSGEGSDELFAGYLHLQQDYLQQPMPTGIVSGIHLSHEDTLPLNEMPFVPSFMRAKAAIGYKLHKFLGNRPYTPEQMITDMLQAHAKIAVLPPIEQSIYLWTKLALSNYILRTLGDGCEMAHSIEGRVPFLDHHLYDLAKRIPMSMKIRPGTDKYILRETVKPYLTDTIIQRKKHPFLAPPLSLLSDQHGYEWMRDTLYHCDNVPFINKPALTQYLDTLHHQPLSEQSAVEPVLMLILTATLLGQRYAM